MYTHVLLDVYCFHGEHSDSAIPDYCPCKGFGAELTPGYECLFNNCPFVSFTSHENAMCYINKKSEAEEIVSLGEDWLDENFKCIPNNIELWKQIAVRKIKEAYEEYEKLTETDNTN